MLDDLRKHYGLELSPDDVVALGNLGGFSGAEFWRMHGEQPLCVRMWPSGVTEQRVAEIHSYLQSAHQCGVGVLPVPLSTKSNATFFRWQQRVVEVAPWMPGVAKTNDEQLTDDELTAAFQTLATLHQAWQPRAAAQPQPAPAIRSRLRWLEQCQSEHSAALDVALSNQPRHALAELGRHALEIFRQNYHGYWDRLAGLSAIHVPLQTCVRDLRRDHVLFANQRVTGLVDFDAMRTDTIALDIARLAQALVPGDAQRRDQAFAAYADISPIDTIQRTLADNISTVNPILSAMQWLVWLLVEDREFADSQRVIHRLSNLVALAVGKPTV